VHTDTWDLHLYALSVQDLINGIRQRRATISTNVALKLAEFGGFCTEFTGHPLEGIFYYGHLDNLNFTNENDAMDFYLNFIKAVADLTAEGTLMGYCLTQWEHYTGKEWNGLMLPDGSPVFSSNNIQRLKAAQDRI
jgi:hypothetical protein